MKSHDDPYQIHTGTPHGRDYLRLRAESGLGTRPAAAVERGLPRTWHAVTVEYGGEPVGMGRIVGDGARFLQVVDVCVLPAHQGRGVGRRIMTELVDALERKAPAGARVSLIADGDTRHLYEKFGFRETAPASAGMARTM